MKRSFSCSDSLDLSEHVDFNFDINNSDNTNNTNNTNKSQNKKLFFESDCSNDTTNDKLNKKTKIYHNNYDNYNNYNKYEISHNKILKIFNYVSDMDCEFLGFDKTKKYDPFNFVYEGFIVQQCSPKKGEYMENN